MSRINIKWNQSKYKFIKKVKILMNEWIDLVNDLLSGVI